MTVPRRAADAAALLAALGLGTWAVSGAFAGDVALAGAHGTESEWATWWAGEVLRRLDGLFTASSTWSPVGAPFYAELPGPLGPFLAASLGLAVGPGSATAAFLALAVAGSVLAAYWAARMLRVGSGGALAAAVAFGTSAGIGDALAEGAAWRAAAWFVPLFLAAAWRLAGSRDAGADVTEAVAFVLGAALLDWSTGSACLGALLVMAAWWTLRPDRGVVLGRAIAVASLAGVLLALAAAPLYATGVEALVARLDWVETAARLGPVDWGLAGLALCVPRSRPWFVVAAACWGWTSVEHPRGVDVAFHGALALGGATALEAWPRGRRPVQVLALLGVLVASAPSLPRASWQPRPPSRLPADAAPGAVVNVPMSPKLRQDDRLVQVVDGRDVLVGAGRPPAEWGALVARDPALRALDAVERGERSRSLEPSDFVALHGAGFRWITVQPGTPEALRRAYAELLAPALGDPEPPWSLQAAVDAARTAAEQEAAGGAL